MTSTNMAPEQVFSDAAGESLPVLETIFQMHLDTLPNCSLDPKTYHLVRIAALIAIGAPPASFLTHLGLASETGVTVEDVQGVAVAIAPLVGTPRITAAAGNVLRGLGLAAMLEDDGA